MRDPYEMEILLAQLDDFILRFSSDPHDVTETEYLEVVDGALRRQRVRELRSLDIYQLGGVELTPERLQAINGRTNA